jgi:eukaryotic-like serine/threonine-protein kinase
VKIRRRMSRKFSWNRVADWFKRWRPARRSPSAWLDNVEEAPSGEAAVKAAVVADYGGRTPRADTASAANRARSTAQKIRSFLRGPWLYPSLFAICLLGGYLWAALVFFPAPFFTANKTVPSVVGDQRDAAEQALTQAGFTVGEIRVVSHPTAPNGQVIWQDPVPEMVMAEGTRIELYVSGGQQPIPVPDVAEYEGTLARRLIEASGLTVARVESVQTAAPKGVAVNTRPTAGAALRPGTGVTLVISRGAPTISVPDLSGLTVEEARDSLEAVGLALGTLGRQTTSAQAEGTVYRSTPPPGTLTAPLTPVDLVLARRP